MFTTADLRAPLLLQNSVRRYAWGSTRDIPDLLGIEPDGGPQAELWLGAHAQAPSLVQLDGREIGLDQLCAEAPQDMLGPQVTQAFGARLPYLLKVLAAGQALSLQVHPSPEQAREGYAAENRAGIAPDAPTRSFHDDQHKPEMILALTQFEGLAGFRQAGVILDLFDGLAGGLAGQVRAHLRADPGAGGVRAAFQELLDARSRPAGAGLDAAVESVRARLAAGSATPRADRTAVDLAGQYPGDPGALASLMLNRFTLDPGEAAFTPAQEVHAYLSGLGVEIMASSDNVLRAGLTPKYVDEEALMRCASFTPQPTPRPEVIPAGPGGGSRTYRSPVSEFALTSADVSSAGPDSGEVDLPAEGPRIVLVLEGELTVTSNAAPGERLVLPRGASALLPHAAGSARIRGTGRAICAWVPAP